MFVNPTAAAQMRALAEREAAVERGAAERRAEIEACHARQQAIDSKFAAREAECLRHTQRRRAAAISAHTTEGYTPQPAALRGYLQACSLVESPVAKAAASMYVLFFCSTIGCVDRKFCCILSLQHRRDVDNRTLRVLCVRAVCVCVCVCVHISLLHSRVRDKWVCWDSGTLSAQ